jgi:ferredoxin
VTPFGLRNRLKQALGRGAAEPRAASDTLEVRFVLPDGKEHAVRCEPRYTLVMASQTIDTPIATGCPDGHCGGCNVDVLEGASALAPATGAEQKLLDEKWASRPGTRLACHAKVVGNGAKLRVHTVWSMDQTRGEA